VDSTPRRVLLATPSSSSTVIANPPPHHFQELSSDDYHVYTIRLDDVKVEDFFIEVIILWKSYMQVFIAYSDTTNFRSLGPMNAQLTSHLFVAPAAVVVYSCLATVLLLV